MLEITVRISDNDFGGDVAVKLPPPNGASLRPCPPPPSSEKLPSHTGDSGDRLRVFCNLCNREGCLSSLFGDYVTVCPACRGRKFLTIIKKPKSRLAGAIEYLRDARVFSKANLAALVLNMLLGLFPYTVFEGFKALISAFR